MPGDLLIGLDTGLGSLLAAFGLSGAAGLNPWLPLLASSLASRFDLVELAGPFDRLDSTAGLAILSVLALADFVGDKIPVVDHVLHVLGLGVAPASGAVLFTGQAGTENDLPALLAILLGGGTAGIVHAIRASVRPASTGGTAGLGNPFLSLGEDAGSLTLVLAAFVVPVVAAVLLALVIGAGVYAALRWRRWRRGRRARRRPDEPTPRPDRDP